MNKKLEEKDEILDEKNEEQADDIEVQKEELPKFTPVIPMRDIVTFPHMVAPIFVNRKVSTIALENALMSESHEVILLAQKKPQTDEPQIADLYDIGILGKVVQVLKFPDGAVKALVEGVKRVKAVDLSFEEDFIRANYEELVESSVEEEDIKALMKLTLDLFQSYIQRSTKVSPEHFVSILEIKEPGKLADIIATYLNVVSEEKQTLIETANTYERLEQVSKILSRELEMLSIEEGLQEKIKFKLGKAQKEYILREKLRAIKDELRDEEGADEIDELRKTVEKAKLPQEVKTKLNKELNRLERMPGYTAETSVIRTYIDSVLALPWENRTKDILDIDRAKKILDKDHYGLEDVKQRILEFLAVKKLSKEKLPTIICFVGPPGVGKTSLAKSIAKSLNKKFAQVSLGGINDESEIRGHRRTYIGSMPGRIIRAVEDAGTKNPLILLDEIEKMIPSHMGDPTAAMLEVLDPAQNSHFVDHYIDIPFDLSEVFFVATANSLDQLYKPLRDRIETIYISGYTEEEKANIAEKFLIPKQTKLSGIKSSKMKIEKDAILAIINNYTREAGVRNLERAAAKLCRKVAMEIVSDPKFSVNITTENLSKYMGTPKFERSEAEKQPQVGLVHGLAWTEVGGELLEIEVGVMPGKGRLNLTGRLGDVMQESAKTALSYARSNYQKYDIPEDFVEKHDLHIHAADGATPKDGPSAGIALTSGIISAITNKPIRGDVAMTGEITLRGRVLPIGGLKEKCIAALRNNITNIIIPKGNKKDLDDIPDYVKEKINFKIVENMDEVIEYIFGEGF
ncbi:MAG: endopeptidase La [bacterium]